MSDSKLIEMHEVTNPHDKIEIDCADLDAARLAVLIVGQGWYGIADNLLPLLVMGDPDQWALSVYGKTISQFSDSISAERLAAALNSMTLRGEHIATDFQKVVEDYIEQRFAVAATSTAIDT